ncbi:hypothetical protein ACQPXM_01780 [Kribbella sp. CA-253562]|uniref:hypothetical protein n=1 Tax=Kribbella sp. CA-253562 TaxID=3239942 RepID=UPI003D927326
MPDRLRIDYNILNDAKKNLHELAGNIKPMLDEGLFNTLAGQDSSAILGSYDVDSAITGLHRNARGTLGQAHDKLIELGNSFGSVGEAFLQFDSEIAQGMGITGSNLGLSNYFRDKALWDYYQAHKNECVPGPDGSMPDFCSAKNPGDTPPLDQVIKTDRGEVHTHLTLDKDNKVIQEDSTVMYDGKLYHSVTDYSNDGNTIVTNTTYPDGSTVKNETYLNGDGSGSMYTRGSDGSWSNYTRGPKGPDGKPADWVWDKGSDDPNDDTDGDSGGGGQSNHPASPGSGGTGHGTSMKV